VISIFLLLAPPLMEGIEALAATTWLLDISVEEDIILLLVASSLTQQFFFMWCDMWRGGDKIANVSDLAMLVCLKNLKDCYTVDNKG